MQTKRSVVLEEFTMFIIMVDAKCLVAKEHIRYIRTNNPISAYALHILNNRHKYGTAEETLELLKPCNKGTRMYCWEALYLQALHQRNILIEEQQVNDINPLYELAHTSRGQLRFP
jgi:hypothetical protein